MKKKISELEKIIEDKKMNLNLKIIKVCKADKTHMIKIIENSN
ncbi:hypothetical protein [Nitrosopumilus sp. S4]